MGMRRLCQRPERSLGRQLGNLARRLFRLCPAGAAGDPARLSRHLCAGHDPARQGFPFPTPTISAANQTFRSIVKPDLWGSQMRFRFSNAFGTGPVTFDAVTVGLQEYSGNVVKGTLTPVTFGGKRSVTIAPGQEIWSDAARFAWVHGADDPAVQGRNLAVSYWSQAASGPMTYHAASNQTSYITAPGSGDHTTDADVFAYEFTTGSWFFLDAVDVMAPAGTVVIAPSAIPSPTAPTRP